MRPMSPESFSSSRMRLTPTELAHSALYTGTRTAAPNPDRPDGDGPAREVDGGLERYRRVGDKRRRDLLLSGQPAQRKRHRRRADRNARREIAAEQISEGFRRF